MQYQQFEDLPVWKRGDELNARMVELVRAARRRSDFSFSNQLRSASLSITNNIAEGFERKSAKEFMHFLSIAKGSAGEVRSMLHQAIREEMLPKAELEAMRLIVLDVSRQLAQFIKYLGQKKV
ncbi:MAG: four helix bundle protein [Bacteroidota bacterium]|jgi:four helix bundle protein